VEGAPGLCGRGEPRLWGVSEGGGEGHASEECKGLNEIGGGTEGWLVGRRRSRL